MRTACLSMALAVALGGMLAAQGQPAACLVLVTKDGNNRLQVWAPGATGYEKTWEAKPRLIDPATWESRRRDAVLVGTEASPVIADYDGDGANELLVMDNYGITAYGRKPAYFPFDMASDAQFFAALAVGDADGDKSPDFVTQRRLTEGKESGQEIAVWKPTPKGLVNVWRQIFPGYGYAFALGDADNDGQPEIVTAADGIQILRRRPGPKWEAQAEVVNIGASVSVIRIDDVDHDGKNELIVCGNSGKITVYKRRRQGRRDVYPVLWQSRYLLSEGFLPESQASPTSSTVLALATGDIDGDGRREIIAGSSESGRQGNSSLTSGRIHVFKFDGQQDFISKWVSDWTNPTWVNGLAVGDLDGDGVSEFAHNGHELYRRDAEGSGYHRIGAACQGCNFGIIGMLGDLSEPVAATRVVPLYWTVPNRQITEGESLDTTLSLMNVWAGTKDVTITTVPDGQALEVANGTMRIPAMPAGGVITTPPMKLTGKSSGAGYLRLEIAAAGGYHQSMSVPVYVAPPVPTYRTDIEARIANALVRAREENRRVLIQWGSNSDKASQWLIQTMVKNNEISRTLLYEYEIVRAEVSQNLQAATPYKAELQAGGLPYLTVLDADRKVLANQPAAQFKTEGEGVAAYDGKQLSDFLKKHQAPYVNADLLFKSALAQVKKEQKTLFVWFSAPW